MRQRTTRRRLLALALGLAIALLAAELIARFLFGSPLVERWPQVRYVPHPTRGFALVPGDRAFTYDHPVRVNALGLRGPELPPKAPGERRILLLGDSLTFGHGVAEEDSIPARLANELRAPLAPTWRVINAGHQGYATRQEVELLLELGERLDPDLVLILWLWNDIQAKHVSAPAEDAPAPEPITDAPPAPITWRLRQLARRSALLSWLNDLGRKGTWPDEAAIARALERVARELGRFRDAVQELDARPVFVVLPDAEALVIPNPSRDVDARVAALAREQGLALVTVEQEVSALIEARGELPVLAFDGHYDAEGLAAIAEGIARGLIAQGLLE